MACIRPIDIHKEDYFHRSILINCGTCPNCRADKISLLEGRAKEEWKKNQFCAFVRFSYDDNHLPYKFYKRFPDGTISPIGRPSVNNDDLSLIPRRIRDIFRYEKNRGRSLPKNCTDSFSWLGCTELGDTRRRPHLHFCFFGLDWCYLKPLLQKRVWPCGSVDVKPIKNGAIRYILNYLEQEPNGELADSIYFDKGLDIPKVSWSKGFGRSFFENNIDSINQFGCIRKGSRFIPISTYYKNKYMSFSEEKIMQFYHDSVHRRLAKASQARYFGFRGSTAEVVKQFERYRAFNSAMSRAARLSLDKLNKVSISEFSFLLNDYFNLNKSFDLKSLKPFHLRR